MKKILSLIWTNRTKTIGFVSVILGVLATSSAIPDGWLKWFVLANGLVTAAVGFWNSNFGPPPPDREL
jgi:hypothetical protein